jgi:hypothetical protein
MLTGADGSYKFTNLVNGTYNVTEEMKTGWTNVSPMSQQVTINGADMPNINFTNQPPTPTPTPIPTPTPTPTPSPTSITVVSPNGGENLHTGDTYVIEWSYTGNPGNKVKIDLLTNGKLNTNIASKYSIGKDGRGTYNWKIPSTQIPGIDYKIRITSITNPAYTDTSDNNFSISATYTRSICDSTTNPQKCVDGSYAGYAVSGSLTQPNDYSDVKGEWTVSDLTCHPFDLNVRQVAVWVGLGGVYSDNDKTIAQIGVDSKCIFGLKRYFAVYEMYQENDKGKQIDKGPQTIADVKPGDKISAEVRYDQGKYILTLIDITQKWHSDLPSQTFIGTDSPANRYSAEWIVELSKGKLAQFDTVTFTNAKVDGNPITSGRVIKQINMVISPSDRTVRAEAKPLDTTTGSSFSVIWEHE